MTCAHVVNVALKKTAGVNSVEVSLNRGLATVQFKPGNTTSVRQLWELIHQKGYSPKRTAVFARGKLLETDGKLRLLISGTDNTLALAMDPKLPAVYQDAWDRKGQTVKIHGAMEPGMDFKAPTPLQIDRIEKQ